MRLLYLLFRGHIPSLVALPRDLFHQCLALVTQSLDSLDVDACVDAANCLDFVATAFVNSSRKKTPHGVELVNHISVQPNFFRSLMTMLFKILVFDESGPLDSSYWALCKPVLPVILAAELQQQDVLEELKNDIVLAQPPELQGRMIECFNELAKDITRYVVVAICVALVVCLVML